MKKVIIIGGGVSGLTAGIYAAKLGYEAEIYEKHAVPGGECTGWDRQGYHIDNCIHWLMGAQPGTALNDIWRTTGALDGVEVVRSDIMYTSELDGQRASLYRDAGRTLKELEALSPEDAPELKKLFKSIELAKGVQIPADKPPELYGIADGVKMGVTMGAALKLFKTYAGMSTLDLMETFKHPLIRCLISDFCTKESLAHSFPMAYGNYVSGDGGIPRGGSRAMALRMAKRFEELGGKLYCGMEAERVLLDGERAAGVQFKDRTACGDYVICACDTDVTFSKLLDRKYMDKKLLQMYSDPEAYVLYGMFQAAFAVESPDDLLGGDVILPWDNTGYPWMSDRLTLKTYAYEPSFAPEGRQIMQALLGLNVSAYDYFKALYRGDKAGYDAKKKEIADGIMELAEQRFPGYKGKLTLLDSWTPVTYNRYCNAYKGYNQSFTVTKNSDKNPYPSAYIKGLENVVLAGQWLTPPGGLPGAAIQGKYAAMRVDRLEKKRKN